MVFIFNFQYAGILSPNKIEKRFKAAFQSLIGIVHFLAILFNAR